MLIGVEEHRIAVLAPPPDHERLRAEQVVLVRGIAYRGRGKDFVGRLQQVLRICLRLVGGIGEEEFGRRPRCRGANPGGKNPAFRTRNRRGVLKVLQASHRLQLQTLFAINRIKLVSVAYRTVDGGRVVQGKREQLLHLVYEIDLRDFQVFLHIRRRGLSLKAEQSFKCTNTIVLIKLLVSIRGFEARILPVGGCGGAEARMPLSRGGIGGGSRFVPRGDVDPVFQMLGSLTVSQFGPQASVGAFHPLASVFYLYHEIRIIFLLFFLGFLRIFTVFTADFMAGFA